MKMKQHIVALFIQKWRRKHVEMDWLEVFSEHLGADSVFSTAQLLPLTRHKHFDLSSSINNMNGVHASQCQTHFFTFPKSRRCGWNKVTSSLSLTCVMDQPFASTRRASAHTLRNFIIIIFSAHLAATLSVPTSLLSPLGSPPSVCACSQWERPTAPGVKSASCAARLMSHSEAASPRQPPKPFPLFVNMRLP